MSSHLSVLLDHIQHSPPEGLDPFVAMILNDYGSRVAEDIGGIIRDRDYKDPYFAHLEAAKKDGGKNLNEQEWKLLEQIEHLQDGEKATLFILSSLAFDRAAIAARIIKKNPGKIGKIIIGGGTPEVKRHMESLPKNEWNDRHLARGRVLIWEVDNKEMSPENIPETIKTQGEKELNSQEGYDIWEKVYTDRQGKSYRVRKLSEAEALARYLVYYCGKKIQEEGIQIVGEEGSIDTRTNYTKAFENGLIDETDTHFFILSDRRHEPAAVSKFYEIFGNPGERKNYTRNNPNATIAISREDSEKMLKIYKGFLSLEGVFSKYPQKLGSQNNPQLRDIHESPPDGIWTYRDNLEHRKRLGTRIINSSYAQYAPQIQHAVNTTYLNRPLTQEGAFRFVLQNGVWIKQSLDK